MKSFISVALGLFLSATALMSQPGVAQAAPVRETRALNGTVNAVRLRGGIDLEVVQSDTPSLVVEARPDQMSSIRTEVRGNELVIDFDSPFEIHLGTHVNHSPRVLLSTKSLERIRVQGSGDVYMTSWASSGDLQFDLSGSGDVKIDTLNVHNLVVSISGSDDVEVGGGSVEGVQVRIAGSGDFDGGGLKINNANVSILGSGDATLGAVKVLAVSIAGSGDVSYYGHPTLSQSIAGTGEVRSLGDR